VRPEAARVHDALRYPLVVEMEDLLAEVKVLEQARPALAGRERVLIVAHRHALLRREPRPAVARGLVGLAAVGHYASPHRRLPGRSSPGGSARTQTSPGDAPFPARLFRGASE